MELEAAVESRGAWTKERIQRLLDSETFNYQAIDLPHGLSTGGHDRSGTAKIIMQEVEGGDSLIDVGSSLGYFCFEAARRRAQPVVGLDFDEENVRKSRLLAQIKNEQVDFRFGDIDAHDIEGQFDHVLCLNVLHHLANPILGLDRLVAATKRRLVLEIATFGTHDARKLGMDWIRAKMVASLPALVVGQGTASEGIKQFYLTPSAVTNLLQFRRGCFASIDVVPSDFKQRFLVIARKRQIEDLLVVSGPGTSSTQSVIEKLKSGELQLDPTISAVSPSSGLGRLISAAQYHERHDPVLKKAALAYDLLRPIGTGATFSHDPALEIIDTSRRCVFLTVWVDAMDLRKQFDADIKASSGRESKRLVRSRIAVADEQRLIRQYREWFKYTAARGHHLVLWSGNPPVLLTPAEWETRILAPEHGRAGSA
jgi:2-polyprenyl-3-methyl-5-hydroxy-6-metoxy-1,4-benzoquinol methylase